ncbi:phosphatidate cytidylyltransferase [Vanrija albida]|uniref:Phosphatidate cytidylyltransferase n=1 Tax=Vanrija albida TaxID=181172 RepID=A0ABR3QDH6_9TREE
MPSFTQANKFGALEIDDFEEIEEVEIEEVEEVDDTPSAPLSKGAKKRAAKAAAKAAAAAAAAEEAEAAKPAPAAPAAKANGASKNGESKNGESKNGESKNGESKNGESKPAAANGSKAKEASSAVPAAASLAVPTAAAAKKEADADPPSTPTRVPSPPAVPSSPRFAPALPAELPTPTANQLPSNRKRRTPEDFTPVGPNAALTAASPNKNSVKFEDGVVPGEGVEGERTITPKKETPTAAEPKKHQNAIERTVWTFIMIFGFITVLSLGAPYMIMLVLVCQTLVYKEVTALFNLRDHGTKVIKPSPGEKGDEWSKTLNWYFFVVTNYFLYGESIIYYFKHIVFVDAYFIPFAKNHRFISFMLYTLGFVGFVANLQRQYLRQQFALFCWVHISLLLIVVSSHFIVNNILEGMIWFFVPASLVICNDVFAYVCGKLFGRTPLIKLSPKKTVEGFIGAFFCTLLFGYGWGTFWMQFPYMICPARDLGANAFSTIVCKPNPVFIWRAFEFTGPIGQALQAIFGTSAIPYVPFQLHVAVMATFASLVAPFGGFFASGFKRAFNIKDFGHSIPGHGGMTDRMDCQFMMGMFAYVYYSSIIRIQNVTVGSILQTAVVSLTTDEQLELLTDLKRFLEGQGVL